MSATEIEALSGQLARLRRALERDDHVEPDAVERLAASIEQHLRHATGSGPATPRDLLTLLDEAEALRAALERARHSIRASIDGEERRRRSQAAYRSATGT